MSRENLSLDKGRTGKSQEIESNYLVSILSWLKTLSGVKISRCPLAQVPYKKDPAPRLPGLGARPVPRNL